MLRFPLAIFNDQYNGDLQPPQTVTHHRNRGRPRCESGAARQTLPGWQLGLKLFFGTQTHRHHTVCIVWWILTA